MGESIPEVPWRQSLHVCPPFSLLLFDGFLSGLFCCCAPQTHFLVGLLCQVPTEIMRRKLASVSRTRMALDLSTTFTPAQTIVFALEGRLMCDLNISESLSTETKKWTQLGWNWHRRSVCGRLQADGRTGRDLEIHSLAASYTDIDMDHEALCHRTEQRQKDYKI